MLCLLITSSSIVAQTAANTSFNGAISTTTFDDWLVNCAPIGADKGLECSMSQRIEFEDNSEPLLKIDLYLNPRNGKPEAVFVLHWEYR